MDKVAQTFIDFINTPWAPFFVFLHSYLESFFLPGGHDLFLLTIGIIKPKACFFFALFSTIGSTLGGTSAYLFARYCGRPIVEKVIHKKIADNIEKCYRKFGMWAVAFAGFTPVPYKIFALCSGFFEINLTMFIIVSFFARAARFYTISLLIFWIGPKIKDYLIPYLNFFSIITLVIICMFFILIKIRKKSVKPLS